MGDGSGDRFGAAGLAEQTEEVTEAVMAASRLLVGLSARALAEVSNTLTLPQLRALVVLDGSGPAKLAALAATLGVNSSTALRMVERLEGGGLVDRKVNPDNRREVILRLTGAGTDLVREVLDHRHREIAALVSRLPVDVRAGLVVGLRALTAIADDPATPATGATPAIAADPTIGAGQRGGVGDLLGGEPVV
ncbi:MarR family winged helix-turn-helix transcriptional regulator [Streptomyces sp. NPDC059928]|uniref:MarR family winged helix-turn-helix transcriptional regulator n=2 Tax=Streptomyces TaxID=1883 RepID=UPI003650534F